MVRAFTVAMSIAGIFLLVESSGAAPHHVPKEPQTTAQQTSKVHKVSYTPDGSAIATGAPRRLSPLAGNDNIAWSYAHGGRAGKHLKRAAKSVKG
jgi:hypothetical protein